MTLKEKIHSSKKATAVVFIVANIILMLLIFYYLLNTLAYNWTGSLYKQGYELTLVNLFFGLDYLIPFVPQMAVFYIYIFYTMTIATMLFFALIEYKNGLALGWSLVIINAIAILVYIVFPVSTQPYRDQLLSQNITGFWAQQVFGYYQSDTSFNDFPSLHAAVSTIIAYTWYRYYKLKPHIITKILSILTIIFAFGVILSTLFVKQHYIADEISGFLLAYITGHYVFNYIHKKLDIAPPKIPNVVEISDDEAKDVQN